MMRKPFGREIALLCLPVLLFGGAALLRSMNGRVALPSFLAKNPFDPGPIRVEFSPFRSMEVQPYDVAEGFEWVGQTSVETRGQWNVPKGWKEQGGSVGFPTGTRLVFRRGKTWKQVPQSNGKHRLVQTNFNAETHLSTLRVDIEGVPPDAEEIRLRGAFNDTIFYSGPIPPGWKPPKNLQIVGVNRILTVESKPFDVEIKGPNDPFPAPQVSRVPDLELLGAGWYFEPNIYSLVVRLRDNSNRGTFQKWGTLQVLSYSLRDGDGKELVLFDKDGAGARQSVSVWSIISRQNFYPNLPSNEAIASFVPFDAAPRGGWGRVRPPLQLNAQVSDGTSWPLKVQATIKQGSGGTKDLAARLIR